MDFEEFIETKLDIPMLPADDEDITKFLIELRDEVSSIYGEQWVQCLYMDVYAYYRRDMSVSMEKLVPLLIQQGWDMNYITPTENADDIVNAVFLTADRGHIDEMKVLVKYGANLQLTIPCIENSEKFSITEIIVFQCQTSAQRLFDECRYLHDHGAPLPFCIPNTNTLDMSRLMNYGFNKETNKAVEQLYNFYQNA